LSTAFEFRKRLPLDARRVSSASVYGVPFMSKRL